MKKHVQSKFARRSGVAGVTARVRAVLPSLTVVGKNKDTRDDGNFTSHIGRRRMELLAFWDNSSNGCEHRMVMPRVQTLR